jgi:hypothetical protein
VTAANLPVTVSTNATELTVGLPPDNPREVVAAVARVLVGGGVAVYRLQPAHTSLESWFLQVTSRLGELP